MGVRSELRHGDTELRLVLDQPKGNILSRALIRELAKALRPIGQSVGVKLVTIEGAGGHFSYGASIEEHRPGAIAEVLGELHDLVRQMLATPAPTAAIVRGKCLGAGFEVALACDMVFAQVDAVLGVPEIVLGVFPPAASALLPARVGQSRAAAAILTGQALPASHWVEAGLIHLSAAGEELDAAVDSWFETNLAPRSAAALGCAALATRRGLRNHVDVVLPELERFYLDTLMRTSDAVEGIEAFIGKRSPAWRHA